MDMRKMMKNYAIKVSAVGLVLVSNMMQSASRSPPAPAVDCSSLALATVDCLSFLTSGSAVQKPEGSCCSGLKTTLQIDAECLCENFKNSAQLGIFLNISKALTLPAACYISAPSISDCGLNNNSNGAPAVSLAASSLSSAMATPSTSSGTTEVAAIPPPGTSGSPALAAASVGSFVLGLLFAYFSLLF